MVNITLLSKSFMKSMAMWSVPVPTKVFSFSSLAAFEAIYGFNKFLGKGDFYCFGCDNVTQSESLFSARTDANHCEQTQGPRSSLVARTYHFEECVLSSPAACKSAIVLQGRL